MNKQLVMAIVICVGLGTFYFFSRESEVRVGIRELILPQIDPKSITNIVYAGKENFSLKRTGADFLLEMQDPQRRQVAASKEAVTELFEAIAGVKSGVFVTEQKAKHNQFKVDESQGQKVSLFVGAQPVWELVIGDYAEEEGRYVRVSSQDAVFLAKARFWDITRNDVGDFRERQIVAFDEKAIRAVRMKKGADAIGLVRDGKNQWTFDESSKVRFEKIEISAERAEEFVRVLTNLRAASFVDKTPELEVAQGLIKRSDETVIVEFKERASSLTILTARDDKNKKFYAQLKGADPTFEISEYAYGRLYPQADDFKDISAQAQID